MFLPRKFDKYTNYNVYITKKGRCAFEIDNARLMKVVLKMAEKYKDPYIRFMWVSNTDTAVCFLYESVKKNVRKTKIVPFDEVEKIIMED